jgi:hypothetical protein
VGLCAGTTGQQAGGKGRGREKEGFLCETHSLQRVFEQQLCKPQKMAPRQKLGVSKSVFCDKIRTDMRFQHLISSSRQQEH